jgi:hypothetical protein
MSEACSKEICFDLITYFFKKTCEDKITMKALHMCAKEYDELLCDQNFDVFYDKFHLNSDDIIFCIISNETDDDEFLYIVYKNMLYDPNIDIIIESLNDEFYTSVSKMMLIDFISNGISYFMKGIDNLNCNICYEEFVNNNFIENNYLHCSCCSKRICGDCILNLIDTQYIEKDEELHFTLKCPCCVKDFCSLKSDYNNDGQQVVSRYYKKIFTSTFDKITKCMLLKWFNCSYLHNCLCSYFISEKYWKILSTDNFLNFVKKNNKKNKKKKNKKRR